MESWPTVPAVTRPPVSALAIQVYQAENVASVQLAHGVQKDQVIVKTAAAVLKELNLQFVIRYEYIIEYIVKFCFINSE